MSFLLSFKEASLEIPEAFLSVIYEGLTLMIIQPHFKRLIFKASETFSLQSTVAHYDRGIFFCYISTMLMN